MASLILSESMILEFERIKNSLNAIVSEFDFDSKLLGKPRSAVLLGSTQYDPSIVLSPTSDDLNAFSPELSFPDIRKRKKSSDNDRLYKSENDINKLFEILSLKSKAEDVKSAKLNRYSLGSQLEFNDLNSSSDTFVGSAKGSLSSFTSQPNITDEDRFEDTPTPQQNGELLTGGQEDNDVNNSDKPRVNDSNEDNTTVDNSDGTVNSSGETITPTNQQESDAPFVLGRLSEQFVDDGASTCIETQDGNSKLLNRSAASQCDFSDDSDLEEYLERPSVLLDGSSTDMLDLDTSLGNNTAIKPEDMSFRSKARMFEVFQVDGITYKRFKEKPSSQIDVEDVSDNRSASPGEVERDDVPSHGEPVEESAQEIFVEYCDTSEDEEQAEPFILPAPLNPELAAVRKRKRVRIKPSHYYIRHPSTVLEEGQFPYIPCPNHTEHGGMSATLDNNCPRCAENGASEFGTKPLVDVMEQARGSTGFLCGLRGSSLSLADSYYQALSPQPCPQTRGYASSMPFLDSEHYIDKRAGRSHSPMSECSRTTNTSRISLAKRAIHNSHRHHSDEQSAHGSSHQDHIDLSHIMQILTTSTNGKLLSTAAGCLQHMAYNHDHMKGRIRDVGGIPILVRLLQAEEEVSLSALGALRNLSYGQQNNINKIAIKDAHGVPLLVQLLKTTENFEIQELITGVFWNLSSSEQVKPQLLRQALEPIVKSIIIPQSGWKGSQIMHDLTSEIQCTTVFRNATGCLRNLSSAGLEGRQVMRSCYGLVDSLLFVLRCVQGKNDVDNKAVENSVCILRNLSYRLESEVSPEHKYGQVEDWRSRGLGGGQFKRKDPGDEPVKKKKTNKKHKGKENATPLPEHTNGVGLLWQPGVVRVYLDLLLECSNPETLEGAAGTLQNLTACSWEPAQLLREAVRREKGLSVISSLLRMSNDSVVRSIAVCLRNLASDSKNKELLGQNALNNLVKRLPGGEGADGITDMTIGAIISTILELVTQSPETARLLKVQGGIPRLVDISRSTDVYSGQCVHVSNRVLAACWEIRDLRKTLKHEGWNIGMLQRLPPPDRTDGLEYDESKNQFKASYNDGLNRPHQNTLTRQRSPSRHRSPNRHTSPSRHLSPGRHVSPHHGRRVLSPSGYDHNTHRAATMGRAADPSLGYHRPERPFEEYDTSRGQSLPARSLPPTHPLNSNYGVADSWV